MITKPKTREEMESVRRWLTLLVETMEDDDLISIANAIETAALGTEGEDKDDPFYSEQNMNGLLRAKAQIESGGGTEHRI